MNSSNLNNPYTARVGDSPLFSDAAVCTEDLNNPYTARVGDFRFLCKAHHTQRIAGFSGNRRSDAAG